MNGLRATACLIPGALATLAAAVTAASDDAAPPDDGNRPVTALGRLQPKDGIIRVSGPSQPTVVIADLLVAEGDRVEAGQLIARLEILEARVTRLEAQHAHAIAELKRQAEMHRDRVVSDAQRHAWALEVNVKKAELQSAKAELERARVRSPVAGTVLQNHVEILP